MNRGQEQVIVACVNLNGRFIVLDSGESWPITCMLDDYGDETDDVGDARHVIAGGASRWVSVDMNRFTPVKRH